jgi:hypothetical protein
MLLFQEGNRVSNNKLIFPVALKTIIIKYNKYNFKQYIHIHNKISRLLAKKESQDFLFKIISKKRISRFLIQDY